MYYNSVTYEHLRQQRRAWSRQQEAVYVVHYYEPSGTPVNIGRLRGADANGVLYIGSTKTARSRPDFNKLLTDLVGWAPYYRELCRNIGDPPDGTNLRLTFELCAENACRDREKQLLREYVERFGELPPFNCQWPGKT